jgi:hypothetical protein
MMMIFSLKTSERIRSHETDPTILEQAHESHKRKRDDQSIQKSLNNSMKSMSQYLKKQFRKKQNVLQ